MYAGWEYRRLHTVFATSYVSVVNLKQTNRNFPGGPAHAYTAGGTCLILRQGTRIQHVTRQLPPPKKNSFCLRWLWVANCQASWAILVTPFSSTSVILWLVISCLSTFTVDYGQDIFLFLRWLLAFIGWASYPSNILKSATLFRLQHVWQCTYFLYI